MRRLSMGECTGGALASIGRWRRELGASPPSSSAASLPTLAPEISDLGRQGGGQYLYLIELCTDDR